MKKQIIIAMGCLAMLPGCDDTPDFEQHYVSENLVIGDLNAPGLVYVDLSPDSVLDPLTGEQKVISFDVNSDGVTDLVVVNGISARPGIFSSSHILSLGTAEINTERITEIYYYYTEIKDDTIEIRHYENQSASQPLNSSVVSNQTLSPMVLNAGDTVAAKTSMREHSAELELVRNNIGTDSLTSRKYSEYDLRFGKWSGVGAKYGSFRFVKDRDVFYGWIKLEVTDYTKIVIYEYAYRKITEI